jgi:hypothetical protein
VHHGWQGRVSSAEAAARAGRRVVRRGRPTIAARSFAASCAKQGAWVVFGMRPRCRIAPHSAPSVATCTGPGVTARIKAAGGEMRMPSPGIREVPGWMRGKRRQEGVGQRAKAPVGERRVVDDEVLVASPHYVGDPEQRFTAHLPMPHFVVDGPPSRPALRSCVKLQRAGRKSVIAPRRKTYRSGHGRHAGMFLAEERERLDQRTRREERKGGDAHDAHDAATTGREVAGIDHGRVEHALNPLEHRQQLAAETRRFENVSPYFYCSLRSAKTSKKTTLRG